MLFLGDVASRGAFDPHDLIGNVDLHIKPGVLITCISNPYFHDNLLLLMLNLCNYDVCYHSFMTVSSLACHLTKVYNFVLFKVNYVFY